MAVAKHHAPGHAIIDYTGYPKTVYDRLGRPMLIRRAIDRRIARAMGLKPVEVWTDRGPVHIWRQPAPMAAFHAAIKRQIDEKLLRKTA